MPWLWWFWRVWLYKLSALSRHRSRLYLAVDMGEGERMDGMEIVRRDKRVRCQKCYHEFWQDADLSGIFAQCTRCGHTQVDDVLEHGKPVIEWRKYEYQTDIRNQARTHHANHKNCE